MDTSANLGFTPYPWEMYLTMRIVCRFWALVHTHAEVNMDVYLYVLYKEEICKVIKGLEVSYRLWFPPRCILSVVYLRKSSHGLAAWHSRFCFCFSSSFLCPAWNWAEWFSFTVQMVWNRVLWLAYKCSSVSLPQGLCLWVTSSCAV